MTKIVKKAVTILRTAPTSKWGRVARTAAQGTIAALTAAPAAAATLDTSDGKSLGIAGIVAAATVLWSAVHNAITHPAS